MSQPTSEGVSFSQKGGNKDLGGYKKNYDKKYRRKKNASSMTKKVTQRFIVQKETRKTARKKVMATIPELFDPVNQEILTLAI